MNQLFEKSIFCPYCGERIEVIIDTSDIDDKYIEDCQVCCRPIIFLITEGRSDDCQVSVFSEDESC
ncbi:CPXCG motif-containing cysteine-rich protein [uncultured Vibrio sp.]|uniref:CPXCG motif-containing cysteine-rich protein n=1 Tax=uncultured Vibrio sp. TaxID=114054 RepID=UPI00092363C3|nr:CPXCG motif-containing cysteine-rich protein [uncultured Vibrio sp.]OIQ26450.1 MAG: hypothetical protein BM561_01450 [Vibrio sp. MedPE-SWchi]